MKRIVFLSAGVVMIVSLFSVIAVFAADKSDLARLKAATAQFHRPEAARQAGWDLVPGLDYCFENPPTGGMGYHYINTDLLDVTVDELKPEAMVYIPGPNGHLQLGGVEFIVPAQPWDNVGNTAPPTAYGHSFHLNEALGVYVLHIWIWKNNPAGMFEDWNPKVSCS